ncbi:putative protein isoform X1 [Capsicum chacoense]
MASSCNSDNIESIMRRAANDNKSSREHERQERRPSSNPNRLEIAIAMRPSPNTTSLANETRVGLIRGGTDISFNASGPFNTLTQKNRLEGAASHPWFNCNDVVTTTHGFQQVMVKRSHDALGESSRPQSAGGGTTHKRPVGMTFSPLRQMIVSYPNPEFPIFDPAQLKVDLPINSPHPCPLVASTKDGFYDSLQPQKGQPAVVVEDNGKEQEAQGVEELAVDAAKARPDIYGGATTHKRPCGTTYRPFGRIICSYPNPEFPIFDPTRLTVNLPLDPPQPYSPTMSNKDASNNLQGEVVEDNAEQLATQGVEAAAAAAAKPRQISSHVERLVVRLVFDPTRLTVDLSMDPPQPYSPLGSKRYGSENNLQPQKGMTEEVVEDNVKELTTQGVEAAAAAPAAPAKPRRDKRPRGTTYNPFGGIICSYPNPEFPVFDPTRLTVDLSMEPPQPYSPLVSKRYGSENNLQPQKGMTEEVVEDNVKELATQGVEAAAAAPPAPAKPRRDKRPRETTYNPFGGIIRSYPNPEFPIFDPKGLTVDLYIDPPKPYLPLVSKKDGSDDNLQPQKSQTRDVVEYNEKEQATQ